MTKPYTLLPLVAKLRTCPSRNSGFSDKMLIETWENFKQLDLEHGDELVPSIMAGLILYDKEQFAPLLNEVEQAQMLALAAKALERFQQLTHPPNKLGNVIAAALKEST